ncbi:hypothetical protein [Pantoea sp. SGAir0183]
MSEKIALKESSELSFPSSLLNDAARASQRPSDLLVGLHEPIAIEDLKLAVFKTVTRDIALLAYYLGFKSVRGPSDDDLSYFQIGIEPSWLPSWLSSPPSKYLNEGEPMDLSKASEGGWYLEYRDRPDDVGLNYTYVETGSKSSRGPYEVTGPGFTPFNSSEEDDPRWHERTAITFDNVSFSANSDLKREVVSTDPVTEVISSYKIDAGKQGQAGRTTLSLEYTLQTSSEATLSRNWDKTVHWDLRFSETGNIGPSGAMFAAVSLSFDQSKGESMREGGSDTQSHTVSDGIRQTITQDFATEPHTVTTYEARATRSNNTIMFQGDISMDFSVRIFGSLRNDLCQRFKGDGNFHRVHSGHWIRKDERIELVLGDKERSWRDALRFNYKNNTGDFDFQACAEQHPEFKALVERICSDSYTAMLRFPFDGVIGYASRRDVTLAVASVEPVFE